MAKTLIMQKTTATFLHIKIALLSTIASLFLVGCGAKGPLYHSPEAVQTDDAVKSEQNSEQTIEQQAVPQQTKEKGN